jgi:hypothetical protein
MVARAELSKDLSGDELQREILDTLRDVRRLMQEAAQRPTEVVVRPPPQVK